jgi:ATP-binding cassette subfamily B multidrug efflux pump
MKMEKKNKKKKSFHPERISSYFRAEIPLLLIITASGLIYNIGMTAGPYYEGRLAQCLYDILKGRADAHDMMVLALAYVLVILAVQGARAVKRFGVRRFANNISRQMRLCLYNSLVHAEPKELKEENLGSLLTKAISDVDACTEGMRKFTTELFDTGVVMIAYTVMLVHYDWRLTILCCLFTPPAYFLADRLKKQVTAANAAYKKSSSELNGATMDRISNALTYRIFGREENRCEAYEADLDDYEKKSAKANVYEGSMTPLYDAIAMLGTLMILYFGSRNVVGTGWTAWNIAAFTTYLACFTKLAVKASHAAKLFNAVQKASVSWKRIKPLMKEPVEDDFTAENIPLEPAELTFDDVSLGYSGIKPLTNISFTVKPGEILGITGEVACGKSMLGKVLIGEVPYQGKITINGKDFASLTKEERLSTITYMGHDPELLSTSFADNITLGQAVDPETYLSLTQMDSDLKALDRKSDDAVGESATMLSGGQQSRLALARTLAHARSILILDDPFAAVDRQTETAILKEIRKRYPDRTILLISHRLYHFPEFDRVLYIHDHTATCLTHDELMREDAGYRALYEEQMKGSDYDEK